MMRKLFYLTTVLIFFGCSQKATKQHGATIARESKFKRLLAKYRDISFDTLKVFSNADLQSSTYPFKGTQLDSTDVALLPVTISEEYINDNRYFACYQFGIDSSKTGLITRTPSTYEPTSVKLFVFDRQKEAITDFIELAESFGDAGDMAVKISWLFKEGKEKYKCFMRLKESHDNSIEVENGTIDKWNYYCLIDLARSKIDTVSKNEKELLKKFGSLIRQEAGH